MFRRSRLSAFGLLVLAGLSVPAARAQGKDAGCDAPIAAAEARYGIPAGLLAAIGRVETGRLGADGVRRPWPWAANAQGIGRLFDTREAAIAWVTEARANGVASIDVGCLQVNLMHHPSAFANLADAFDPALNADYAGRLLVWLRNGPAAGIWMQAAGFYHSQTPELAQRYRDQVERTYAGAARGGAPTAQITVTLARPRAASPLRPRPTIRQGRLDPLYMLRVRAAAAITGAMQRAEYARLATVQQRERRS